MFYRGFTSVRRRQHGLVRLLWYRRLSYDPAQTCWIVFLFFSTTQAPTSTASIDSNQAALQAARGEIGAARAEKNRFQEATDAMKAEAARKNAEIDELGYVLRRIRALAPFVSPGKSWSFRCALRSAQNGS